MNKSGQQTLFPVEPSATKVLSSRGTATEPFKRIDNNPQLREKLLTLCRLKPGEFWEDPDHGHRIGVFDVVQKGHLENILGDLKPKLIVNDPPYNVAVGNANTRNLSKLSLVEYMDFSRQWVANCVAVMAENA